MITRNLKMFDKKQKNLVQAKSYSSIYEMLGLPPNIIKSDVIIKHSNNDSAVLRMDNEKNNSELNVRRPNQGSFVTSERFHSLNKADSCKGLSSSRSTVFCDLDNLAKKKSFHCYTKLSKTNFDLKSTCENNKFTCNTETIVQDCAANVHPKLRDSLLIHSKKTRFPCDSLISSEIFLRDDLLDEEYKKSHNCKHNKKTGNRNQKFWSYSKYETEYVNSPYDRKKSKKKEGSVHHGKRVTDPCPCQLFSYACPCATDKSQTELSKQKSAVLITQVTSTSDLPTLKTKRSKHNPKTTEEKLTNTVVLQATDKTEVAVSKTELGIHHDIQTIMDAKEVFRGTTNRAKKAKIRKKMRRIILCPKCNEKVEITSTTDDEGSLKFNTSAYRASEMPGTATYAYRTSSKTDKKELFDDSTVCNHEPRCEILPICQILPTDNLSTTNKSMKETHTTKSASPRVIRITKACRHHPPCTVVPSCQKNKVLQNNCEFIPPCLHRPRCVNLPLCVPFCKSLYYDELIKHEDILDSTECHHNPKCKYIPICQRVSLQNDDKFVHNFEYSADHSITNNQVYRNPCSETTPTFRVTLSNKSCQYHGSETITNQVLHAKESLSDAVIFIRDVGCQFRNRSPKNSVLQSKTSSSSFDYANRKIETFFTDFHTLRYEDKCTNPIPDLAASLNPNYSVEINSQCFSQGCRQTGFAPGLTTPFVASLTKYTDPILASYIRKKRKQNSHNVTDISRHDYHSTLRLISRKSSKGKHNNTYKIKTRRKSRTNSFAKSCSNSPPH